jgi:hypothetical protein
LLSLSSFPDRLRDFALETPLLDDDATLVLDPAEHHVGEPLVDPVGLGALAADPRVSDILAAAADVTRWSDKKRSDGREPRELASLVVEIPSLGEEGHKNRHKIAFISKMSRIPTVLDRIEWESLKLGCELPGRIVFHSRQGLGKLMANLTNPNPIDMCSRTADPPLCTSGFARESVGQLLQGKLQH